MNKYLYITLLSLLGFSAEAVAQAISQTPQLVVTIAIDQLRTDQMETYAPLYTQGGFRRLMTEGKIFPQGGFSFTPADATSATASLATGSTPYYNGITGKEWLNRSTLRPENIIGDTKALPTQLLSSTLGDELKVATNGLGKVVAVATTAECAILSAGHNPNATEWVTTPAEDINRSVTNMVLQTITRQGLGQDDFTDLLYIGYTLQPTIAGYQLMDHNIADLINGIRQRLAGRRILFVLAGTGSRDEDSNEDNERYHIPTGKVDIRRTANLLNMYLGAIYGSAQYVETCHRSQIYLNHQLLEKRNIQLGDVLRQAQEFLLQVAGVRNVYTATQLLTSDSPMLQRVRNGYNIDKSGDLLLDIAPGWQLVDTVTNTLSTSRIASTAFPIIFYGHDISHERIVKPVTIDQIAPTVARIIRIRAPNACDAQPLF